MVAWTLVFTPPRLPGASGRKNGEGHPHVDALRIDTAQSAPPTRSEIPFPPTGLRVHVSATNVSPATRAAHWTPRPARPNDLSGPTEPGGNGEKSSFGRTTPSRVPNKSILTPDPAADTDRNIAVQDLTLSPLSHRIVRALGVKFQNYGENLLSSTINFARAYNSSKVIISTPCIDLRNRSNVSLLFLSFFISPR